MYLVTQDKDPYKVNKFPQRVYDRYIESSSFVDVDYDVDDMVEKYHKEVLMDRSREYILGEEDPKQSTRLRSDRRLNLLEMGHTSSMERPNHGELFLGSYDRENTLSDSMKWVNEQSQNKIKKMWDRNKISDKLSDANITDPRMTERVRKDQLNHLNFVESERRYKDSSRYYLDYETDKVSRVYTQNKPNVLNFTENINREDDLSSNNNIRIANTSHRDRTNLRNYLEADRKDNNFGNDDIRMVKNINYGSTNIRSEMENINEKVYSSDYLTNNVVRNVTNAGEHEQFYNQTYTKDEISRLHNNNNSNAPFKLSFKSDNPFKSSEYNNNPIYSAYNNNGAFNLNYSADLASKYAYTEHSNNVIKPFTQSQLTQSEINALGLIKTDYFSGLRDIENKQVKSNSDQNAKSYFVRKSGLNIKLSDSYNPQKIRQLIDSNGDNIPDYMLRETDNIMHKNIIADMQKPKINTDAKIEQMVKAFIGDTKNVNRNITSYGIKGGQYAVADYSSIRMNKISDIKKNTDNVNNDKLTILGNTKTSSYNALINSTYEPEQIEYN